MGSVVANILKAGKKMKWDVETRVKTYNMLASLAFQSGIALRQTAVNLLRGAT